jgi:DNA-binding NarL/FixJ family response regulator
MLEPQFEVVGTFNNGEDMLAAAPELAPDVVILDVCMPTMNGLTASIRLRSLVPKVKVIFLTMNSDMDTAGEAFRAGAHGYVLKTSAFSELSAAIREVLRGGYFATPSLTEGMIGSFVQNFKKMKPARDVTARQKEILKLLVEGRSMKQVANVLNITARTVAYHKYAMMEQLNLRSSAELLSYAMNKSWAA